MKHYLLDALLFKDLDSQGNQGVDAFEYPSLSLALQEQKLCRVLNPDVRTIVVSTNDVHNIEPPSAEGMPPIVIHQRIKVSDRLTESW